ncbi:MAG: alpha-amylase family glycosyl hydrolase [Myxococcota bacterium]
MWWLAACAPESPRDPWVASHPVEDPFDTVPGPSSDTGPTGDDPTTPPAPLGAEGRPVYLVMPDRFADGDPANDGAGDPGCFDPNDPWRFHGGDWRGLADHADYLAALGVGAVWITPPVVQVGCGYHGYWADLTDPDDRAVEPALGAEADLAALADALHARDIWLVLDLVPNHVGRGARIVDQHPDWFHDDADCAGSGQPDVDCALAGLPDFDQYNPDASAYLVDQAVDWVTRYDADAVRLDTAKHLPADWLGGTWVPALQRDRDRPVIGEIFDEGGYDQIARYLDAGLPTAFDFPLRRALVDAVGHGGSIDLVASRVKESVDRFGIDQANRMVHMLDNHDVPRFTEEVQARPADEVARRYAMGLGILATAPGVPQLTWGAELGMRGGGDPDNRRDFPDWGFDPATRTGDPDGFLADVGGTWETTRGWLAVRARHPALSTGGYGEVWRHNDTGPALWVYFRSSGEDRVFVVVHAGTTDSGPVRIHLQQANGIPAADKAAMPDGVPLAIEPTDPGVVGARVEGGELVFDDLPALSVIVLDVG